MGEVVGAGLLAHVPTIMLPGGDPAGAQRGQGDHPRPRPASSCARRSSSTLDYDTVVVLDSHWATTVEFVVTAQHRRAGLFTSEELPRGMCRMPYDWPGDPELAQATSRSSPTSTAPGSPRSTTRTCRSTTPPSTSGSSSARGCPTSGGSSIGVCQTGDMEDFLRARPRARPTAIAATRPPGAADRLRRPLAHVLAAARAARPRGQRPGAHLHRRRPATADYERIAWFKDGRPRQGARHHAGVPEVQARGEVLPLPDDGRRPRRAGAASPGPASTASTRTRSAPARCTSGSTARPTAGPAPAARDHAPAPPAQPHPRSPPCPSTAASCSTAPPSRSTVDGDELVAGDGRRVGDRRRRAPAAGRAVQDHRRPPQLPQPGRRVP